jgi:hypothetical protein
MSNTTSATTTEAFKDPETCVALLAGNVVLEASALRGQAHGPEDVAAIAKIGSGLYREITCSEPVTNAARPSASGSPTPPTVRPSTRVSPS